MSTNLSTKLWITICITIYLCHITTTALVTTMINATTDKFQEQWLIYHSPANYGPNENFNVTSVPLIAPQITLCEENDTYNFSNHIILAMRGDCSFFQKTYIAQKYNATGIVIGNINDGPLVVMSHDQKYNTTEISIPTIMVRKTPFEYITKMTSHAQPFIWPPEPTPGPDPAQFENDLDSSTNPLYTQSSQLQDLHSLSSLFPPATLKRAPVHISSWPLEGNIRQNTVAETPISDAQHALGTDYSIVETLYGPVRVEDLHEDPSTVQNDQLFSIFGTMINTLMNSGDIRGLESGNTLFLGGGATSSQSSPQLPFQPKTLPSTIPTTSPMSLNTSQFSVQTDPFDPDDPDAGPFYFLLTLDERGESFFPYFNLNQIQFFLLTLVLAPLLWITFLFIRWFRLYWGFRCVEELVTFAASNLPICVFVATNEAGEIIFDSGEGTASNNIADMMKAQEEAVSRRNSAHPDGNTELQSEENLTKGYGATTTTSSTSDLFSSINGGDSNNNNSGQTLPGQTGGYFNKKSDRYAITTPTDEMYRLLKEHPTVSNTYVANSVTGPNFALSDTSKHLHFQTKTSKSKDTKSMSYNDVSSQSFGSVDAKTHFRVHSDTCNICLENFVTGDQVKVLGCYHLFHPQCIDHYFNSHSTGLPTSQQANVDDATRAEQRRMYANMYLHSSYDFDELTSPDANGPDGTSSSSLRQAGQSCPVCRKSILQTARMNSVVRKKWWIKLFEWICMCSCCCPSWRRSRRERDRLEAQSQGPVLVENDEEANYDPTAYRYSYEATRRGNMAVANNANPHRRSATPRQSTPDRSDNTDLALSTASANPPAANDDTPFSATTLPQQQQQPSQQPPSTIRTTQGYNADDYSY